MFDTVYKVIYKIIFVRDLVDFVWVKKNFKYNWKNITLKLAKKYLGFK
jgi:N12 class adenine-specific DNA methylase